MVAALAFSVAAVAASVTFSIEPNEINNPNETVTFYAQASGMGDDVTYMYTIEGSELSVNKDNTWTPADDGYGEGEYTVYVTVFNDDGDYAEESASLVIHNITPAKEVKAEAAKASKEIVDGRRFIVLEDGTRIADCY